MSINETMGDKRPVNKPGVYQNPDGQTIETAKGDKGMIQADAIVQQGYKWVAKSSSELKDTKTPKTEK